MILGVPNYDDLNRIASGWLNLAWAKAIGEAQDFQEIDILFDAAEEKHGRERVNSAIDEYWQSKNLELNNALSLLQQALELFLKARIAEVSPFLLISGDPHSWPAPDKSGHINFTDLRTIDSVHLCKAARAITTTPLSDKFVTFYDRLRKTRNKIVHLNGGNAKAEISAVLVDILTAHQMLFSNQLWIAFRRGANSSDPASSDAMSIIFEDDLEDHSNDVICREVEAALHELEPKHAKAFFGYDSRKASFRCPTCLERRTGWTDREWEFMQVQKDKSLFCVSCLTRLSAAEYKSAIIAFFGYLDDAEQQEIAADLERDFPEKRFPPDGPVAVGRPRRG
jgi:hypothetical protein